MKTIKLLLLLLLTAGCSTENKQQFASVDPAFVPFLEAFIQDSIEFGHSQAGQNIPINFAPQAELIKARCHKYSYWKGGMKKHSREILVDQDKWNVLNEHGKKTVIYHELGHCLLNREHLDDDIRYNFRYIKSSIMHSLPVGTLNGTSRDELYLYELFNNDQTVWSD